MDGNCLDFLKISEKLFFQIKSWNIEVWLTKRMLWRTSKQWNMSFYAKVLCNLPGLWMGYHKDCLHNLLLKLNWIFESGISRIPVKMSHCFFYCIFLQWIAAVKYLSPLGLLLLVVSLLCLFEINSPFFQVFFSHFPRSGFFFFFWLICCCLFFPPNRFININVLRNRNVHLLHHCRQ